MFALQDFNVTRQAPPKLPAAIRATEDRVEKKSEDRAVILVVHERTAECECLTSALAIACPDFRFIAQSTPPLGGVPARPDLVLTILDEIVHDAVAISRSVDALKAAFDGVPFVIVTEEEATVSVSAGLFAQGASGCISHSAGLEGLTKMLWLVLHGGMCFPRNGLTAPPADTVAAPAEGNATPRAVGEPAEEEGGPETAEAGLTSREAEVVEKLRMGKPNKIIAYELGISISTVKVHLRNIMRKTGATNRVEAVLLTSVAPGAAWPIPSHR
jgi:DNA-binding NarL/FixJ family response regulator